MMSFENQSLNKEFVNAYQDIKAPESLKRDTLKRMYAEEEKLKQGNGKMRKRKRTLWYYLAVAAAFCIAILVLTVQRADEISYVTPMEKGIFYDEVILEDGMIRFLPERVIISVSPNAGQAIIGQEEAIDGLPYEEETELIEMRESESGGELKFLKESIVSVPETKEDNWSYIGEQKIYVSVLNTEGMRYQAVYEKDGSAYEVIGTNVTQKEFIDYLYQKINN